MSTLRHHLASRTVLILTAWKFGIQPRIGFKLLIDSKNYTTALWRRWLCLAMASMLIRLPLKFAVPLIGMTSIWLGI
jgi:hypothetical protein